MRCPVQHILHEAVAEALFVAIEVVTLLVSAVHGWVVHSVSLVGLSSFVVRFQHGLDLILCEAGLIQSFRILPHLVLLVHLISNAEKLVMPKLIGWYPRSP